MELVRHSSDLWIRKDPFFGDAGVIAQQSEYRKLSFQAQIVLDAGANIGAFTAKALSEGALEVHAYEPDEDNAQIFLRNHGEDQRVRFMRAALGLGNGTTDFYLSNHYTSCHTTVPTRGRRRVTVPKVDFLEQLRKVRPTVLKMDIEGGEFELLTAPLPDFVRQVAVELHLAKKGARERAIALLEEVFSGWVLLGGLNLNWHISTPVMSRSGDGHLVQDALGKFKT